MYCARVFHSPSRDACVGTSGCTVVVRGCEDEDDDACQCKWIAATISWFAATLAAGFHLAGLLHHVAVAAWTLALLEFGDYSDAFVQRVVCNTWRYITGWNFAIQLVFLAIRCSSDLAGAVMYLFGSGAGGSSAKHGIESTGNIIFQGLVFPLSTAVCTLFWSIYYLDQDLVFPCCFDNVVPKWWNHAMHSVPGGIAVCELIITGGRHCWRRKRWVAISMLQLILLCYDICVAVAFFRDGEWLYPVYASLPCWSMRLLHLAALHCLALFFYFFADQMGTFLHAVSMTKNRCLEPPLDRCAPPPPPCRRPPPCRLPPPCRTPPPQPCRTPPPQPCRMPPPPPCRMPSPPPCRTPPPPPPPCRMPPPPPCRQPRHPCGPPPRPSTCLRPAFTTCPTPSWQAMCQHRTHFGADEGTAFGESGAGMEYQHPSAVHSSIFGPSSNLNSSPCRRPPPPPPPPPPTGTWAQQNLPCLFTTPRCKR